MSNIWKQNKDVKQHPNRNNFDLSFFNHCTLKMGGLYPVFCKPVVPGDSFRIDCAFDLKLMPLVFPVQSRMRAHMHYFYVRNKNLWENWKDWIEGLKTNTQHPHPYLVPPDSKVKSGSIYDFLNVPTTVVTDSAVVERSSFLWSQREGSPLVYRKGASSVVVGRPLEYQFGFDSQFVHPTFLLTSPVNYVSNFYSFSGASSYCAYLDSEYYVNTRFILLYGSSLETSVVGLTYSTGVTYVSDGSKISFVLSDDVVSAVRSFVSGHPGENVYFAFSHSAGSTHAEALAFLPSSTPYFEWSAFSGAGFYQYSDLGLGYYRDVQPLNALPFRAYESIYYAYYSNSVLQPLVVNGVKEYNKFNHTVADGKDETDYHLFCRNYELDFLTSALPSPQQGVAPLVGMTALGNITIEDENGITTAQATIDNDGTISKVVLTSPAASVEHARTAMNIAASGMSINDFRNVNALQRFLEQTLRSGYRYRDFIAGHFGKEPEYRELDMPEFIGGFSRDVNIGTVISQADTAGLAPDAGAELGSFVGNGRVVGGSSHSVSHYCDDFGYIMGILCVTPTPAYSQLLPRDMKLPTNYLDYYFPDFSQIGMQPITYREVVPLQAWVDHIKDESKGVDDVFGYQRPNYDLVASVDEVHGEFRGSMRNFLVNRIFSARPELGSEFLEIDPEEVNEIFANVNPDDDTIIGKIAFIVHAKRPVPRVHIPGLGR